MATENFDYKETVLLTLEATNSALAAYVKTGNATWLVKAIDSCMLTVQALSILIYEMEHAEPCQN